VLRIDGIADAALHFDAEDEGVQEVAPAHPPCLRQRQERGGDRPGRMDDGFQMRVVEIEDVRGNAVDERGVQEVELVAAAEDCGLARSRERAHRRQRAVDRRMDGAADGAPGPVEE
jgi:hypothetical protein